MSHLSSLSWGIHIRLANRVRVSFSFRLTIKTYPRTYICPLAYNIPTRQASISFFVPQRLTPVASLASDEPIYHDDGDDDAVDG